MVPGTDQKNFDFFVFLFAGGKHEQTALSNGENSGIKTIR